MYYETIHGQRLFYFQHLQHSTSSTTMLTRCLSLIITAISTLRKSQKTESLRTLHKVWLGGDHYKWRQMRTNGVDEKYITGDATDREKFQKWAETLEMAIGNPLYHWSHLELQRYFGYNGILNGDTAEEVWNLCNAKLQEDSMSVRNLIKQSNVKLILYNR